jgi:hypothetical protein
MELLNACKEIAKHYYGGKGIFAYEAFEDINARFFEGELPTPLIQWALTAHGRCLGLTASNKLPVITLHPSLLGGTEKKSPWGVDPALLGVCYAYDVLLHECIHVSTRYLLKWDGAGDSSHNNPVWVGEVNRIAPLLGFEGIDAQQTRVKRITVEGEKTKRGKDTTKPARVNEGNIPYDAVCGFPHAMRQHFGILDFYQENRLPFHLDLQGETLRGL